MSKTEPDQVVFELEDIFRISREVAQERLARAVLGQAVGYYQPLLVPGRYAAAAWHCAELRGWAKDGELTREGRAEATRIAMMRGRAG